MASSLLGVVFAYLAVRPEMHVAPADNNTETQQRSVVSMRVESVRNGDLRAKMQAKNQCVSTNGWRVLFGFYVKQTLWRKHVNTVWSKCAASGDWEQTVREGLCLADKFSHHNKVYVNASAQSSPPSPLLSALQMFTNRIVSSSKLKNEFWNVVCSQKTLHTLSPKLKDITRSLNACDPKEQVGVLSLSAWGLSGVIL